MKKILLLFILSIAFLGLSTPVLAGDDSFKVSLPNPLCLSGSQGTCHPDCNGNAYKGSLVCTGVAGGCSFKECCDKQVPPAPITGGTGTCVESFPGLLATISKYVTGLIATLSVLVFLYAGFLYVTSGGSPDKISKGNKAVIYAVVGIAIALGGAGLVAVIEAVVGKGP